MDNYTAEKAYQTQGLNSQRRYPNEAFIQFLSKYYFDIPASKRSSVKILELGCGSGANLWMVAREGFSAYGIDIAQTGIKLCKQTVDSWGVTADTRVGNMKKLEFKNSFFDVIFDIVSMQQTDIETHIQTYREVFSHLKRGGRFFSWHLGARSISFLNGRGKPIDKLTIDNVADSEMPLHNNGLSCFLTPTDAKEMLESVGFRDISVEIFTRTYKNMTQLIEYLSITVKK